MKFNVLIATSRSRKKNIQIPFDNLKEFNLVSAVTNSVKKNSLLCCLGKNKMNIKLKFDFEKSQQGFGKKSKFVTLNQILEEAPTIEDKSSFSTEIKKFVHTNYSLQNYQRSNQDTCLNHRPSVSYGQWVQKGDLLADCAASSGGELSLGQNLLIAYMPWEGYNYEDAILISERLVFDDLYTSIHIEKYEIETRETKQGNEEITCQIPDTSPEEIEHLDSQGIVKVGSWVQEGDILVGKITPINKKNQSPYQKLLYTILEKNFLPVRDSSLRAPKGINAKVVKIQIYQNSKLVKFPSKSISSFQKLSQTKKNQHKFNQKFYINTLDKENGGIKFSKNSNPKSVIPIHIGKICSKNKLLKKFSETVNNNKLILRNLNLTNTTNFGSGIAPKEIKAKSTFFQNSQLALKGQSQNQLKPIKIQKQKSVKKRKLELSKKPILSATNLTVQLYLAEKRKVQVGDKLAGRHGNKGIISQILPRQDMPYLPDGTPIDMVLNPLGVPSRMNVGQIYECLLGLAGKFLGENYKIFPFDEIYGAEASRSFVYSKLNEARKKTGFDWIFNPNTPGKMRLYDGRTGDCFDQAVTVGQAYILRLVHMVDDKIHARSTGPYSLVTQQPLRGRSKQGGQRLGEMEVWALEGYGAAFILLEMLTIKSDDMTGRMTLWSNLILNQEISIGTPESFKVLICELQALCIDIGLFRTADEVSVEKTKLLSEQISGSGVENRQPMSDTLSRVENLMNLR